MSPLLLIFVCTVVLLVINRWRHRRIYAFAKHCESVLCLPIVGHALYLIGNGENIFNSVLLAGRLFPGKRVFAWILSRPFFIVQSPEDTAVILNSPHCIAKSYYYGVSLNLWLGNGLLTAPTKTWSVHRKMFAPAFNKRLVDSYIPSIINSSEKLVSDLAIFAEKSTIFDLGEYLTSYTYRAFCGGAMGLNDVKPIEEDANNYYFYVEKMKGLVNDMIFNFRSITYYTRSYGSEFRHVKKTIDGFTKNLIVAKKKEMTNTKNHKKVNQDSDSGLRPLRSFLDLLLDSVAENFTEKELYEEINTFLFAGTDTTSTTIGFALLALGMCKDIQQLVHDELDIIFSDRNKNEPMKMSDLPQMSYLTRVIKETMRMFPVAAGFARQTEADVILTDGITLPAGVNVGILLLNLHRNPNIWKNPLEFDPDRFLDTETIRKNSYAYIPFSAGPRNCIGEKYGMITMKVALAALLRKYKVKTITTAKTPADIRIEMCILNKPVEGFKIKLSYRDHIDG